jgi:hypothetical protein
MKNVSQRLGATGACILLALALALAPRAGSAAPAVAEFQVEGASEVLLPGRVSRAQHELQATMQVAGDVLVFGCSDCSRSNGGDLWQVQLRDGQWVGPGRAKPSSRNDESAPSFTPEGGWLYYLSDRKGGFGGTDLYRVAYWQVRQSFATAENLGPAINSAGEEGAASAGPDGHYVVFASRGREGARGWDLFESRRVNGKMDATRPLAPLNTPGDEFDPALLANDAGLVFARRSGGAQARSELWFAPRRGDGFAAPVRLPEAINAPGASVRAPQQDHHDPQWLMFTRIGADGASDIHRIRYRIVAQEDRGRAADDR